MVMQHVKYKYLLQQWWWAVYESCILLMFLESRLLTWLLVVFLFRVSPFLNFRILPLKKNYTKKDALLSTGSSTLTYQYCTLKQLHGILNDLICSETHLISTH
jgi:hypothetical protein